MSLDGVVPTAGPDLVDDERGGLEGALNRIGLRSPLAQDVLIAGLVCLVSVGLLVPVLGPLAHALGVPLAPGQRLAVTGVVVGQALALALRRLRPVVCLVLVVLGQVTLAAMLPPGTTLRLVAPLVATYTVGTLLPPRRVLAYAGAAAVSEAVGGYLVTARLVGLLAPGSPSNTLPGEPGALLTVLAGVLLAGLYAASSLVGVLMATRRENARLARERLAAARVEEAARADLALRRERSRMARELHDIAAHHLSGLVVQTAAAERLISSDPDAARESVRSIRAQGRDALANLRLMVGVLRDSVDTARADAEMVTDVGLGAVDRLVAHARNMGDDVAFHTVGDATALAPVAAVTAYRVLQEALANARQHAAGAPVHVRVIYEATRVRLEVENGPGRSPAVEPTGRRGLGLVGMRERAQLVGGTVISGTTEAAGWRVVLSLPRLNDNGELSRPGSASEETA